MNATLYTVIDAEPSRRFPVYTRGNSGEVFPNVMTPLTGSLIGDASTDGQSRAMLDLGVIVDRDVSEGGSFGTGVFGGYLYANLSLVRVACERAPGLSAADADRQMAGLSPDAPSHRSQRGDRSLTATVRSSWVMGSHLLRPDISEVDEARAATDRWRASIPDPSIRSDDQLIDFVQAYPPRFAEHMRLLLTYTGYASAGTAMMEQFADRVNAEPGVATMLTAGLGTIDSAMPAFRLWALGRQVAASRTLTHLFDDGAGLGAPLDVLRDRSAQPDVNAFLDGLDDFLEAHGARGPDEWELASPTWGTNPEIALAAIDRLRNAPEVRDPTVARRRLAADRERVTVDLRRRLGAPLRPVFDRLSSAARLYAEGRERAKAVFIDDTYPVRKALFELAGRTRERGGPSERRDFFLVTCDELRGFVADPRSCSALVDERRRNRDYLQQREPPFVFDGELPDPAGWRLRSAPRAVAEAAPLSGQGVCAGIARGIARIVRDPADPRVLLPGDILVAPITDPAWTPLFLAVAGVVVEVGAQQSHAAIVSRELGIPAIVGVADATTRLADGQMIEIDGATGTVTIC